MQKAIPPAIVWASALPFFVMPVPLIIDAPGIYGGYRGHVIAAAALAGVGLVVGLLVARGPQLADGVAARPRLRRALGMLAAVPPLLVIGHLATLAGTSLADAVRDTFAVEPAMGWDIGDVWGPGHVGRICLFAVAIRAGLQLRGDDRVPRFGAVMVVLAVATAATRFGAFGSNHGSSWKQELPLWILCGLLVLAWPWLRTRGRLADTRWWRFLERITEPVQAVVRAARQRPAHAAATGVLALALLTVGMLGLVAATVVADGLLGLGGASGAPGPPRFGPVGTLAWLALVARDGLGRRAERTGQLPATWALLVGGRVVGQLATGPGVLIGEGLAALFAAAAVLGRGPRPGAAGLAAVGLLAGSVAGTYTFANLIPAMLPSAVPAVVGAVAGAALGWHLASREAGTTTPLRVAALLALVGIGSLLPMYIGVAWGLDRVGALAVGVLVLPLLFVRRIPRPVPPWLVFYGCFVVVHIFQQGPGEAECRLAVDSGGGDLLMAAPEGGQPYDVAAHPQSGTIVASFKQIGQQGGFLEVLDPSAPELASRLHVERPDGSAGPFWPERIEVDPLRGRLWVQLLGIGAYAMWELEIDRPEPDSTPGLRVTTRLPIEWGPGNPAIDAERRRMALSYIPNRQPDNPLVEVFGLDDAAPIGRTAKPVKRLEMADYVVIDPPTGNLLVPAYFDFVRFAITELDGASLDVVQRRETFHPTVGLAVDETAGRIYITNVLRGTVDVLDRQTLRTLAVVPAPGFPRDVAWDEERGRLFVGGHADGRVRVFDRTPEGLALQYTVQTGSLLRGLGLDRRSGLVFAASGCGLFALPRLD